jgi:Flp pilus assembly protein TadG
MLRNRSSNRRNRCTRKGAAVVEFAVCLPVIILVVFGGIEAASMLFLRQTLVQASYEGAKTAIKNRGTTDLAINSATQVLNGRSLNNFTIEVDPPNVELAPSGQLVTITVTAPGDENSLFPFGPFKNQNVVASASMVKE